MKKIISLIMLLTLTLAPLAFTSELVSAKTVETKNIAIYNEDSEINTDSDAYKFMKEFVTEFPDRTTGTKGCDESAIYLSKKFAELGLEPFAKESYMQQFKYMNPFFNDKTETTNNVIGIKKSKNKTDKKVIIGAYYDNAKNLIKNQDSGNGAMYNATGVGSLLAIAKNLQNVDLDFNVHFVCFGAKEVNMAGSHYYLSSFDSLEKKNIMLMINLQGIGAGDKLYMYDDEIRWKHFDYVKNIAKEENILVNDLPKNKKTIMLKDSNTGLMYSHEGLMGDNAPFIAERIPALSFYSGNYENFASIGFQQSANFSNTYGTSNDNLKIFDKVCAENGIKQMNDTVKLVSATLKQSTFCDAMEISKKDAPDYSFFTNELYLKIIVIVTAVVIILGLIGYYSYLNSKAQKSNDKIKPMVDFERMYKNAQNQEPSEDIGDPFGIDDNYKNKNNNNSDRNNPFGF